MTILIALVIGGVAAAYVLQGIGLIGWGLLEFLRQLFGKQY